MARSQQPITSLFLELHAEAVVAGEITDGNGQQAVYSIVALNSAFIHSLTLGNEYGLELPDPQGLARFCLQGWAQSWTRLVRRGRRAGAPPPRAVRRQRARRRHLDLSGSAGTGAGPGGVRAPGRPDAVLVAYI